MWLTQISNQFPDLLNTSTSILTIIYNNRIAGITIIGTIAAIASTYFAYSAWKEGKAEVKVDISLIHDSVLRKNVRTETTEYPGILSISARFESVGISPKPITFTKFILKVQKYKFLFWTFGEEIDISQLGPSLFFPGESGDGPKLPHILRVQFPRRSSSPFNRNIYAKALSMYLKGKNYSGKVKLIAIVIDQHRKIYKSKPYEYDLQ